MRTEQILLVLETAKHGSITKAAQNLFLAQPNASSTIAALEIEVGYKIFERTYNGVRVTKEGEEFLQYAKSLQRILEKVYSLGGTEEKLHHFIATYAYSFTETAFLRFCDEYMDTLSAISFGLKHIGTIKEGVDMLEQSAADIAVITCREELYGQFECEFGSKGLIAEDLGHMSLQVVMSEKHPLAGQQVLNLNEFTRYPLLSNAGLAVNFVPSVIAELLKNSRMHIVLEPGPTRFSLLMNHDSFAICTPYLKAELEQYHLISRAIPNTDRRLLALVRAESRNDVQVKRYLELLKEEVEVWMKKI